jgi:curved DNA-binding protein
MEDYYQILRVNPSATETEIRRAYRILARRYHPDVNPGKDSAKDFRNIAEAYAVLKDPEKRKQYDIEYEAMQRRNLRKAQRPINKNYRRSAAQRYYEAQKADLEAIKKWQKEHKQAARPKPPVQKNMIVKTAKGLSKLKERTQGLLKSLPLQKPLAKSKKKAAKSVTQVTILEVSVTIPEAVKGVRRTIEIDEAEGSRKINVSLPAGVRNGSIIRLRSATSPEEEVVIITRLAKHPFLSIEPKGLIVEVPITVGEALNGASIMVPTLEEPTVLKLPPNTQSGTEFRLRNRGIAGRDTRGDLFVRVMIYVPESVHAVGIKEKAVELDGYYEQGVRRHLPSSLLEL